MPAFTPDPQFVPGMSRGTTNRDLYDQGRLAQIDWFRFEWDRTARGQLTIVAYDIAAEPAPPPSPASLPAELEAAFQALGQPVPGHIAAKFAGPRPMPVNFSNAELLEILRHVRDFQKPENFLGIEVFITGRLILSVAMSLIWPLRKARRIRIFVPQDMQDICFWERNPQQLDQLVPGDTVHWTRDRNNAVWSVQNVGARAVNIAEQTGRGGRGGPGDGATLWVRRGHEISWA